MKLLLVMSLLTGALWVTPVYAQMKVTTHQQQTMQKLQSMTPEERAAYMQNMEKTARRAQACLNDHTGGMERLQEKVSALKGAIESRCKAGLRDEAQAWAIAHNSDLINDPYYKQVQECSKELAGDAPSIDLFSVDVEEMKKHHVCDSDKPLPPRHEIVKQVSPKKAK